MRLTEQSIKQIPAPDTGYSITWDDDLSGFGLRTMSGGVKAFILNYRTVDDRQRRQTLGRWPALSATAARKRAMELRAGVHLGDDPVEKKRQRRTAPTFADIAEEYLERHAAKKRSGYRDAEYLRRDVLPRWGSRKARDIRRRDVLELIERKAEHAPTSANRLLACVRKVFNWAISRDLLETNPCVQVQAPGIETARDRVLSESEIAKFWAGLDGARMSAEVRTVLRLILITAQRPGEVCEIENADIDGEWWTVTAAKAKNKLSHRVPVTSLAREQLEPRLSAMDRWLFPSPRGNAPIQVNALARALRNNKHFGLDHFTPHDLRRSAATMMGSTGTGRLVLSKILNHKETGVTAVYDRATYDGEKRLALAKWDRKLRAIISGEAPAKVVAIDG